MTKFEVVRYSQQTCYVEAETPAEALAIAKDLSLKQFSELKPNWAVYNGDDEVLSEP